ncbi:protein kinase family protein [Parendozoicomonas haliclonae]|uniref:protein kinase family protein n=1 Tax=Parendozoicomonas haliclonae TaxID=1960125 RepID=UPI002418820E|nr:protein kinase family protein [Parendozoicomonas haliclonae]
MKQDVSTHINTHPHDDSGSFARIWKVEPVAGEGDYKGYVVKAAKPLDAKDLSKMSSLQQLRTQVERQQELEREARALQVLQHDNIVVCIGAFEHPSLGCLLTMERMEGDLTHLDTLSSGYFSANMIYRISQDTIQALTYIHSKQWVHGDFHDGNVLFRTLGEDHYIFKVGDMGSCQPSGTKRDIANVPQLPPEISSAWKSAFPGLLKATPKTNTANDIWAFSAMLIRLLTRVEAGDLHQWLQTLAQTLTPAATKTESACLDRILTKACNLRNIKEDEPAYQDFKQLATVCSACQNVLPRLRPTADTIATRLERVELLGCGSLSLEEQLTPSQKTAELQTETEHTS